MVEKIAIPNLPGSLSSLRVLRVLRVARVLRLLRFFKPLWLLVIGRSLAKETGDPKAHKDCQSAVSLKIARNSNRRHRQVTARSTSCGHCLGISMQPTYWQLGSGIHGKNGKW